MNECKKGRGDCNKKMYGTSGPRGLVICPMHDGLGYGLWNHFWTNGYRL